MVGRVGQQNVVLQAERGQVRILVDGQESHLSAGCRHQISGRLAYRAPRGDGFMFICAHDGEATTRIHHGKNDLLRCLPYLDRQPPPLRAEQGLRQADAGKKLGLSADWVGKVESGEIRLDLLHLVLLWSAPRSAGRRACSAIRAGVPD